MDEMTEFERQYPILLKENAELREKIAKLDKLHQRDVMTMDARAAELQLLLDFWREGAEAYAEDVKQLQSRLDAYEIAGYPLCKKHACRDYTDTRKDGCPECRIAELEAALIIAFEAIESLPQDALGIVPEQHDCAAYPIRDEVLHNIVGPIRDKIHSRDAQSGNDDARNGNAELGGKVEACHADRDGDCEWPGCPQVRDGEPAATGRHCPLDTGEGR